MDFDISKLEEYGVDPSVGIDYTGSKEKYIVALQRYLKSYESNRARVMTALEAMDIEDYTIIVHSLKSNSRMIGAGGLSSDFESLELAGKAGNTSVIVSDTPDILKRYDMLVEQLKPLGVDAGSAPAAELSADKAAKTAQELLDALDEYDDELSAKLASALTGYPFEAGQREMLDKAIAYIGDFMYDEAADIIRDITAVFGE
ncbi:MAG: hypothetical protein IK111_05315 [Lachnospiraceae bacterium]|nr:hypothetical protein [Lachnospiraceae bacterium]